MIDEFLEELSNSGLTPEQLQQVRMAMANYALAALMDSEVRKEAEDICEEQSDNG